MYSKSAGQLVGTNECLTFKINMLFTILIILIYRYEYLD